MGFGERIGLDDHRRSGLGESPVAATMTTSPRLMGIEFGYGRIVNQRVAVRYNLRLGGNRARRGRVMVRVDCTESIIRNMIEGCPQLCGYF
jgi:hypothetical protein